MGRERPPPTPRTPACLEPRLHTGTVGGTQRESGKACLVHAAPCGEEGTSPGHPQGLGVRAVPWGPVWLRGPEPCLQKDLQGPGGAPLPDAQRPPCPFLVSSSDSRIPRDSNEEEWLARREKGSRRGTRWQARARPPWAFHPTRGVTHRATGSRPTFWGLPGLLTRPPAQESDAHCCSNSGLWVVMRSRDGRSSMAMKHFVEPVGGSLCPQDLPAQVSPEPTVCGCRAKTRRVDPSPDPEFPPKTGTNLHPS